MNEPQKKDITDEIDELISQSANIENADIYERYGFISKLLTLTQRQASESLDDYTKLVKDYDELANKYIDIVKKYDEVPELLFTSFSLDPVGTLEILLHDIDRMQKIKDQSGEAWKWQLVLTFRHRLKIAWKLLFRPTAKEDEKA